MEVDGLAGAVMFFNDVGRVDVAPVETGTGKVVSRSEPSVYLRLPSRIFPSMDSLRDGVVR